MGAADRTSTAPGSHIKSLEKRHISHFQRQFLEFCQPILPYYSSLPVANEWLVAIYGCLSNINFTFLQSCNVLIFIYQRLQLRGFGV